MKDEEVRCIALFPYMTDIQNWSTLILFLSKVKVIPIFHALECYAEEKSRLRKLGQTVADFDLLIAASAVTHGLTLVTNNTRHFKGIRKISLEDWTNTPQ